METIEKKDRQNAKKKILFFFALLTFIFNCDLICALATEPKDGSEPSASSLMEMRNPIGRVGGYRYDGSLAPTPGKGSRFATQARYGSAGNIVGLDPSREGSRFQNSDRAFQSRKNYDALRAYSEYRRLERENGAHLSQGANGDKPRLVVANPPSRLPNGVWRTPRYGKTQKEILDMQARADLESEIRAQRDAFQEALSSVAQQVRPNEIDPDRAAPIPPTQQLWMRGRASQSNAPISANQDGYDAFTDLNALWNYDQNYIEDNGQSIAPEYWNGASPLGGAVGSFAELGASALPTARAMTPAETKAILEEFFELQILRSPDVNPLSPIQVDFNDGVVTLRGVVPTPSARVAAGNLLLADPRVTKVNNMTTYVREEDGTPATSASESKTQGAVKTSP